MINESELRKQLEQHHAASCGWTLSCCSSTPELADDVLQASYLKVLQGGARYHGRATFKTWLFAVIRLTALEEKRRQWLRWFRLSKQAQGLEPEAILPLGGHRLDQSDRLEALRKALVRLPKRQQEALHLVFYQDLTVQEAAEVMGISVGSARTHYERGKQNVRCHLERSKHFYEYREERTRTETAF